MKNYSEENIINWKTIIELQVKSFQLIEVFVEYNAVFEAKDFRLSINLIGNRYTVLYVYICNCSFD